MGSSPSRRAPGLEEYGPEVVLASSHDTTPPVISDDEVALSASGVVVTWGTDEPASSQVDYGLTASYGSTAQNGALVTAHSLELSGASCGQLYHYRVASADAGANTASTADATFNLACSSGIMSDSFSGPTLDPRWEFLDPVGDVPPPRLTGTDVVFDIPCCGSHDEWTDDLNAVQLVEPAEDENFEIEAKWSSRPGKRFQFEGLVVRQDDLNLVRFDVLRVNATTTKAFAAVIAGGAAVAKLSVTSSVTAPVHQRVGRDGDTWTFDVSGDGETWTTVGSFDHPLAVTQVGVLAGNYHSTPRSAPAFSASLDYFHDTANPFADDLSWSGQVDNDDFSSGFDADRWTFVNPNGGDSSLSVTGGNAVVSVPGGSGHAHDAYLDTLTVPRLDQQIGDGDFETEIRFSSTPSLSAPNQVQGLLVRESDSRWVRFDTQVVDNRQEVFAAVCPLRRHLRAGRDRGVHVSAQRDTPSTVTHLPDAACSCCPVRQPNGPRSEAQWCP